LRLATEWLGGDHRVRAGRARVDLVVDHVGQLQDVGVAHRDRAVVDLTGATVVERDLAVVVPGEQTLAVLSVDVERREGVLDRRLVLGPFGLVPVGTVEGRRRHVDGRLSARTGLAIRTRGGVRLVRVSRGADRRVDLDAGPSVTRRVAEVTLEDLTHVHTTRYAEGAQDDVDRRAGGHEGHVLLGQDLGDDALVTVASGELVALGDLALLGDVDLHQLIHARLHLVVLVAAVDLDVDDLAGLTVGNLERGVAHFARLLTEDRAQQSLFGRLLGLTLRRDLADEDVAGLDFGADAHDAEVVQVREDVVGQVRDVASDLLGTELGVASVDLVLLHVDRRQHVVTHETLVQDDGVFVVVALPRHVGDEQVLAERELAVERARAVGQEVAVLHRLATEDQRLLVDRRVLVRAAELVEVVLLLAERLAVTVGDVLVVLDDDAIPRDELHDAVAFGDQYVTGVERGARLHAGADERRLGHDERHGLLLHVGAHECALGVVVLDERDERGRDRDDLLRRHVHQLDFVGLDEVDLGRRRGRLVRRTDAQTGADGAATHEHALGADDALLIDFGVGLGDDETLFFVGGEVLDLTSDLARRHDAVRRLDEAVLVDARVVGEVADESDVRTLGRLDRAHASVVRGVHVSYFEAGSLAAQSAWSQGRETTLVRESRQRVVLVHELAELRGREELLDRRHHGTDVDERLGRDRLDVLGVHALAHDALHARKSGAQGVLDQFAHAADAAVREVVLVVDVVRGLLGGAVARQVQQVRRGRQDFSFGEYVHRRVRTLEQVAEEFDVLRHFIAELAVELVAA